MLSPGITGHNFPGSRGRAVADAIPQSVLDAVDVPVVAAGGIATAGAVTQVMPAADVVRELAEGAERLLRATPP
jgi:hypothetical protein